MYEYQRLSVLDLQPLAPLDPKKLTPMRIKIARLERSNEKLVKDWKRYKKDVGRKIVDFWACVTEEVSLWIKISLPLMRAAFGVEILIFLFPIVYLALRRRQVKAAINAKNENIEQEGDIGKVIFDNEREGDEEYMVSYKRQLKMFNSVKLKEVTILEEEIRLLKRRNFLWETTGMAIFVSSLLFHVIHLVVIAVHTGKNEDILEARRNAPLLFVITIQWFARSCPIVLISPFLLFEKCLRRCNRYSHKSEII